MKRDMDLVRELLLEIENGKNAFQLMDSEMADMLGVDVLDPVPKEEADKREYHLELLQDAKFIECSRASGGYWHIKRITWSGHDFIDSVRDPKIWKDTKEGAKQAGGFTVDILKSLAKGIIKKQIEHYTNIDISF